VQNTPPETIRRHLAFHWDWIRAVAPALLAGLAVAAWLDSVSAADRSNQDRKAAPGAVYSVGKSGSSLKWTSQRQTGDKEVKSVQYTAPADATKQTPSNSPFGDPFGDKKKKKTPAPAPAEKLNGDAPQMFPEKPAFPAEPKNSKEEPFPIKPAEPKNSTEQTIPAEPAPSKEIPPVESKKTESVLSEPEKEKKIETSPSDIFEMCPSPKDAKNIKELTTNILPPEGDLPRDCPLGDEVYQKRQFSPITYTWTASGLCHKPLYFEDVQLERYGHMAGPWVQPFASGAHFFATIPILPYKMGLEPPFECMYSLGYYRPGDCAPYLFDPIPLSVRGALYEAGGWVGGCFLFP
jgi:hypothetical protein